MPAPQLYNEHNIDPFAADSTSVYSYSFHPTVSPTDFQLADTKTFMSMMDSYTQPLSLKPKLHKMKRSVTLNARSRTSESRKTVPSTASQLYDAPISNHQSHSRSRIVPPIPARLPISNGDISNIEPSPSQSRKGSRRPPSPPSPSKLRTVITPPRPAPSPPTRTLYRSKSTSSLTLPPPPFMVPSSSILESPLPRRPAPKRSPSHSPHRRSPDLYKHALKTCFTMSPAGQKTREMGARMAMRLWNANRELERLVQAHSEALASIDFENDYGYYSEPRRSSKPYIPERPSTPSPSPRSNSGYLQVTREPSPSVTAAILADLEYAATSPTPSGSFFYFDDDREAIDPFMQLPPVSRSLAVPCY